MRKYTLIIPYEDDTISEFIRMCNVGFDLEVANLMNAVFKYSLEQSNTNYGGDISLERDRAIDITVGLIEEYDMTNQYPTSVARNIVDKLIDIVSKKLYMFKIYNGIGEYIGMEHDRIIYMFKEGASYETKNI